VWAGAGLVNGATGTLIGNIFASDKAAIVATRSRRRVFAEYTGPLAISGLPGSVLINPVSSN
jgi:hypothetical protein